MHGRLEVIRGCMFSGKTEELCRRLERLKYAGQSFLAFKPSVDNRYSESNIVSHTGYSVPAINTSDLGDIMRHVQRRKVDVVAIDEVQFFADVVPYMDILINEKYRVIVSGLDTNYKGQVFGCMGELLALADEDVHLKAICVICKKEATRTQLLVNREPASVNEPVLLIGGDDDFNAHGKKYKYQARCRACHTVSEG